MAGVSETIYYHGGVAGLRPGARLLPPSVTGVTPAMRYAPADLMPVADEVYRDDRVYLTTDLAAAKVFAAFHLSGRQGRGGDVYRVAPVGPVENDPDYQGAPGGSVRCAEALVVGVVATGVRTAPYAGLLATL